MRRLLTCSLVMGLLAGPAMAAPHPITIKDLLAMKRISDARVSPDGKAVLYHLGAPDLARNKVVGHIRIAAVDGSWDRELSSSEGGNAQARWNPVNPSTVYFTSSRSGSSQVWSLNLRGGEAQQVTHLPLDVDALEVAPDGRTLLLSMAVYPGKTVEETRTLQDEKEKGKATGMLFDRLFVRHWDTWNDGTRNHVFTYDLATGGTRDLMPAMDADCPTKPHGGSEDFAVSPDGKTVVFSAKVPGANPSDESWTTNFDLFAVPVEGGVPRKLTTNPAWDAAPRFSPDGRTLAYLAMSRPGFEADRFDVVLRDLGTGKERTFVLRVDDTPRGDRSAGDLTWSADGKVLYCLAEDLGQRAIFAMDPATGKATRITGAGTVTSLALAGGRLLYGMNSLQGPTELYTVDPSGKDVQRVTKANDGLMAQARLGRYEQFSFKGAKGDVVHGYLVYPVDFDPARKYPVAFLVHGGPQGTFGNDWHYRWNPQIYAGAGYAALMVDFHGSTSYGQAFTDAIRDDWGGAPFEDLMKGLDFALGKWSWLDKDRCAALGASYGGFMINWIAGHTDRFKALVCHDGNLDERMAYYDTEELWFPEWEHKGLPWENAASYTKHNPIEFVKNWKTPMLVIHGMKDYRISYAQGLSTFTALQRKGIPSKLLIFPDENHWVLRPANSLQWHETVLGWLGQWIGK